MKSILGIAFLIASSMAYAAQTVTLADGRQVQLNDDFTWQYVAPTPSASQTESVDQTAAVAAIPMIPVIEKKVGTVVELNSKKPVMQLSDSGVEVLLGSAYYESGQLVIPTSLTNQSSQSIVLVEMEVELIEESGNVAHKQTFKVWTSIKRMADTYLRPQQALAGNAIQFSVEQANQYQINAEIVKVESR